MEKERIYIAIDLKSFYASVECAERALDPLTTNLVVADSSRTNKTICLAVSPSLKELGISGRPRLFEVEQRIKQLNEERRRKTKGYQLKGKSYFKEELINNPNLAIDYIVAIPRMAYYIEYSTKIYKTYLKYVAPEDIHVYSIDEVFIDVTNYLKTYKLTAHELAIKMIHDVLNNTGVTATAGIGTNLYLAKVAMDIVAKHMKADKDGVRIAELDEMKYRQLLWSHRPITDFWRVGKGYAKRLEKYNLYTMGDIARFSLKNDGILYDEFGINAELLIDHAWGYESCNMKDIKAYKPNNNSLSSGQVLMEPYTYDKALIIVKEMIDNLVLDLVEKKLVTNNVGLYISYDSSNELNEDENEITTDFYGRTVIKPAGASISLKKYTSSTKQINDALVSIYKKIVNPNLTIRRINISANNLIPYDEKDNEIIIEQFDLFTDIDNLKEKEEKEKIDLEKEAKMQEAIINLKHRFGKNAVLKGTNYEEGATGRDRNKQIGGHKE